jgi:hypothetical protein
MVWRFSLQNPHINQQRGFATLEALLISLQAKLESRLRPGRMSDLRVGTLLRRLSAMMFMHC